ncbi:MAG: DUF1501 domain-containing protein [Planctomycetaceae bacterium]
MTTQIPFSSHGSTHQQHAFTGLNAREREGLVLHSRRNMLKVGMAGLAGLTLPDLLRLRAEAAQSNRPMNSRKSVVLLWMAGGPSHIDTWDPKPERPYINRGPFGVAQTSLPGVIISEHLPKQAAMMDKFTLIRSVDCRFSNHEPNTVMQTANLDAEARTNPKARMYPSIASLVAKFRGPNDPSMPPYVAFQKSAGHLAYGGYLGKGYDPFIANMAVDLPVYTDVGVDTGTTTGASLFNFAQGLSHDRIQNRQTLLKDFDRLRSEIDGSGSMESLDTYSQQAVDLVVGGKARDAFDISQESDETRAKYGKHLWLQQCLLARRLVEAGTNFVTIDLSYHAASGTWDTHGDNIPPYGGIRNGLGPLLPLFDHLITTLVGDLDERGLLDECLVIAMGEFGRSPNMGTQDSVDGRNHWPVVMSIALAGGGMRHGQVIGSSEYDGGTIASRPVTPGDLAATIYRHMEVPVDGFYLDPRGRPNPIVNQGHPIAELF